VAGLSIEDGTGDESKPLYALSFSIERIKAARSAIDAKGVKVLLTARAESHLVGHADPLKDVLKRLTALRRPAPTSFLRQGRAARTICGKLCAPPRQNP
jgi:2-methylisocitrate lyase-like PEP mutase family enzyme